MDSPSFIIDSIIIGIALYLVFSGSSRGVLRALIGPFSIIISLAISGLLFYRTHNIIYTLAAAIAGPIILAIALSSIMIVWHKTVSGHRPPCALSRVLGGTCNLFWGGFVIIFVMIGVAMFPLEGFGFAGFKNAVTGSRSYALIARHIAGRIPFVTTVSAMLASARDPDHMMRLQSTPEFEAVYKSEPVQDLLADEESLRQIRANDLLGLMANPRIHAILQDQSLLKNIFDMQAAPHLPPKAELTPPKVYEIENGTATLKNY